MLVWARGAPLFTNRPFYSSTELYGRSRVLRFQGNHQMKRLFLLLLMPAITCAGLAYAQTPAAAQPQAQRAPAAPGSQSPDPSRMYATAIAVVRAVDAGQAAELWNSSSTVTRNSVKREAFVSAVTKARTPLGAVSARDWIAVSRQAGGQNGLPAGNYLSVEFVTIFSGNRRARELVSFRLDEDGVWRFTGYTLR